MNREQLQRLASEWTRMAKNDIRNKVISFMREVDASERELAYALTISEGELQQILEGNGEITLSTFAKLLIATGNALEIKPIEETPIGNYNNLPSEEELSRMCPRPNVFTRRSHSAEQHPHFDRPTPPRPCPTDYEDDNANLFDRVSHTNRERFAREMARREVERRKDTNTQPRDEHGRFMSTRQNVHERVSPFESKTTSELTKIIKERLWDSEIDLNHASKADLVEFLDEKNKRMSEYKRMRALEEDPKVNEFKNKLRNTLNNNPHLREWAKKFLGDLAD